MSLGSAMLLVLLSIGAAAQSALAQTSGPAKTAAPQDLAEQLTAQVPKWFEALGTEGRVPSVFTGITRDARQLIIELNELPFNHAKRRDFLIWLSWKQSLVAYAYATRAMTERPTERNEPTEQLVIYASSFEKDVVTYFNLVRRPGGAVAYGRDSHVTERAKAEPAQPFWGLHRGLRPDQIAGTDEFEQAFAALEAKIFWRQVQKPAEAKSDGATRDLIERAFREYGAGNYEAALRLGGEAADHVARQNGQVSKDFAAALNIQALSQKRLQRVKEAEVLYRRAIEIFEVLADHNDKELAVALDNLASLYLDEARYTEAEALRLRALQIFKATLQPTSPSIGTTLQNLGVLYQLQRRFEQARNRFLEALPIIEEAMGADSHELAVALDNLAGVHRNLGEVGKAEPLYLRAIAIFRKVRGREHPDTALALQNYAILLSDMGRLQQAESLLLEAIKIQEGLYGTEHPSIAAALNTLALIYIERQRWAEALESARRSARIAVSSAERSVDILTSSRRNALAHRRLAQIAFSVDAANPKFMNEAFVAAQNSLSSEAARAMSQLSVRHAVGDGALASLLRERQDLIEQATVEDKKLIRAVALAPDRREPELETRSRQRLGEITERVRQIDLKLDALFPQYAKLSNPTPVSISDTQALLRPNEALLQIIDLPESGNVKEMGIAWLITKERAEWVRLPLGTEGLARAVATLRCGLDAKRWLEAGSQSCAALLNINAPAPNGVLPFDLDVAFQLYQALFGPFEKVIAGRSLLLVASGALTELPPAVLVTAKPGIGRPPTAEGYRETAWLGARQPITMLPSVGSLKALRESSARVSPPKSYLGIGNPLLDGRQDDPEHGEQYRELAQRARDAQDCMLVRARARPADAIRSASQPTFLVRRASADLDAVRQASPLPETAEEICAVADRLGAASEDILLGGRATETTLKTLSEQGQLARYGILHFATHGALAGELRGGSEPGLLLTPSDQLPLDAGSLARDDGFLTVSEIATLKLNADWVILSACNTAGSSGQSSAALSGIGRAFIYAGSRALLASHWEVGSDAAVKLVTKAVIALKTSPQIGRAEAMQRSMRDLIEYGDPADAHPSQWAPFVVVGEGAAEIRSAPPGPTLPKSGRPARTSRATAKPKAAIKPSTADWQQELWRR